MLIKFYRMNFTDIPLGGYKHGFLIVSIGTWVITGVVALIMAKKKMF